MKAKVFVAVSILLCIGGIAYIALGNLGGNLVYYWTPSEVLQAGEKAYSANVRLGGMVSKGTIQFDETKMDLHFEVTDGATTIPVHGTGMPPQMFREGIGVVVEGTWTREGVFESDRLLVKHDNQYKAPGDGKKPTMEEMMKSMEGNDS